MILDKLKTFNKRLRRISRYGKKLYVNNFREIKDNER